MWCWVVTRKRGTNLRLGPGIPLTLLISSIVMQMGFAVYELVMTLIPMFRAADWGDLDNPASPLYIPNFKAAIVGDVVGNILLLIVFFSGTCVISATFAVIHSSDDLRPDLSRLPYSCNNGAGHPDRRGISGFYSR